MRGRATPLDTRKRRTASTRRWLSPMLYGTPPVGSVYPVRSTVRFGFACSSLMKPSSVVWAPRSEEHTSELQSPCNLVCRLLLEKKKPAHDKAQPTYTTHKAAFRILRVARTHSVHDHSTTSCCADGSIPSPQRLRNYSRHIHVSH